MQYILSYLEHIHYYTSEISYILWAREGKRESDIETEGADKREICP